MEFTAVTWNLFHGRDFPPDPALFTWRSRLLRITERSTTRSADCGIDQTREGSTPQSAGYIQVNRDLRGEFAAMLAAAEWDVALLQECPPRFAAPLARACGAEAHRALTSRNSLAPLRGLAARLNPDLIASGEGGSNLTLVRPSGPLGGVVERHEITIREGAPERRAMALTRTSSGLCVANLHATANRPRLAAEDVLLAARTAREWAGDSPLLFGGDLNLRPAEDPFVFERLRERFALDAPTAPDAIDHLLGGGLEIVETPARWPAQQRELSRDGLALRLSDHAPVEARFAIPAAG